MATSDESTTNRKVSRSRKTLAPRVKWTEEMEKRVLQFARDNLQNGRDFEKPSAPEYYRKFLQDSPQGFEDVTPDKMVQHVKQMKRTYTAALEWRNKTGQGILESNPADGLATVEAVLIKKCKYFKELDEILGEKPQFNPPFIMHLGGLEGLNNQESSINDVSDSDILLDSCSPIPVDIQDVPSGDSDPVVVETSTVPSSGPPKKKLKPDAITNASAALEYAMKTRVDFDQKRLEWEKEVEERRWFEMQTKQKLEISLQQSQLDFEKQKWMEEFHQRKINDERMFEMEKLRIEKDAELARLKAEQEFELQKLKLSK